MSIVFILLIVIVALLVAAIIGIVFYCMCKPMSSSEKTNIINKKIITFIRQGDIVTATKLYSQLHGVGLKEAKAGIEEMTDSVLD